MDQKDYRVYTVMGDGELAEGSVWEGVMSASHYKLDNLCAVVDRNRLQISGSTEDIMHHDDLEQRFSSFGWHVVMADGNDIPSLDGAFEEARSQKGRAYGGDCQYYKRLRRVIHGESGGLASQGTYG